LNPKVSIIVPNFNHKTFLQQRLETVFGQTYQDFEVILLDDASTDGSRAILQSYKDHPKTAHLIINNQNSGSPFKQWQKGIELSKGEYIWIAESDDYCELNFLEILLGRITANTGICYSQTTDVNESGKTLLNRIDYTKEFKPNIWKNGFEITGHEFIEKYLLVKNIIPNASAVIFKHSLIDNTVFCKKMLSMKMCGDWFFWVRVCGRTNIVFIPESLNYFRNHNAISRQHDTSLKKKTRLQEEGAIRSYVYGKWKFNIKSKNRKLMQKWFRLHKFSDIFSAHFYGLEIPQTNAISLFLKFISYKLK